MIAPIAAAIAALRAQSCALHSLADALEQAPAEQPSKYLDQYTAPIPRRAYLAHARKGAFPTKRVGKRVLCERDVFDGWLTTQGRKVPAAPVSGPRDVDAEAIAELGARRAVGAR